MSCVSGSDGVACCFSVNTSHSLYVGLKVALLYVHCFG